MRTLSLSIPPMGTSIGQGYLEKTPCNVLVSHTYTYPPPSLVGQWGDLDAPNSMLSLSMGCKRPDRQVDSTLRAVDSLEESIPIRESPYHHLPSVGLR